MSKNTIALGIVGVTVLGLAFYFMSSSPRVESTGSSFVNAYEQTAGAVLLDVRTPAEFSAGHIKGAVNIDFENPNFASEVQKLDTAKTYFVYCRSGNRLGQAIRIMEQAGIRNIEELKGGIVGNQSTITLVQ